MTGKFFGFALSALLFALCFSAQAQQQAGKVPVIGLLASAGPSSYPARIAVFEEGLRDLGYRNIVLEPRYAEGKPDRLADLAAQLVEIKVDVILATSDPSVRGG